MQRGSAVPVSRSRRPLPLYRRHAVVLENFAQRGRSPDAKLGMPLAQKGGHRPRFGAGRLNGFRGFNARRRDLRNAYLVHDDGSATVVARYHGRPFAFLLDAADLPLLAGRTWIILRSGNGRYYVGASHPHVRLHRLLLDVPAGFDTDHMSGDSLDNRRPNLRAVTRAVNQHNRVRPNRNSKSGTLGVTWNKRDRRWQVRVMAGGRLVYLGAFKTREAAQRCALVGRACTGSPCELAKFQRLTGR